MSTGQKLSALCVQLGLVKNDLTKLSVRAPWDAAALPADTFEHGAYLRDLDTLERRLKNLKLALEHLTRQGPPSYGPRDDKAHQRAASFGFQVRTLQVLLRECAKLLGGILERADAAILLGGIANLGQEAKSFQKLVNEKPKYVSSIGYEGPVMAAPLTPAASDVGASLLGFVTFAMLGVKGLKKLVSTFVFRRAR